MPTIESGAANAVRTCMAIEPIDRVVVITDHSRREIGEALARQAELAGATSRLLVIEDFLPRPALSYPPEFERAVAEFQPTVSFFAADSLEGELGLRMPMMNHLIRGLRLRHGHMPGIDEQLMVEGMSADYQEISRLTHKVNDAVKAARHIEVQTPSGTDLRATFDPSRLRWHPCPGIYDKPGEWGNLPEGETFTCPASVDGVIGAEVLGDYFSGRYGVLETPARFELEDGRVRRVEVADNPVLLAELEAYLATHENSNRAGEYAIGTNIALNGLTGNLLQDEKLPGLHVAFGNPYPHETGADWECPTHIDVVATRSTIKVDGQYLMRDGVFVI